MNRVGRTVPFPKMRVDITSRALQMKCIWPADAAESRFNNQIPRWICVVGRDGEEPGHGEHFTMIDPGEVSVAPATQYDPSLIEAFFGMAEPDVSEPLHSRL